MSKLFAINVTLCHKTQINIEALKEIRAFFFSKFVM